jgi:hypothetical protein
MDDAPKFAVSTLPPMPPPPNKANGTMVLDGMVLPPTLVATGRVSAARRWDLAQSLNCVSSQSRRAWPHGTMHERANARLVRRRISRPRSTTPPLNWRGYLNRAARGRIIRTCRTLSPISPGFRGRICSRLSHSGDMGEAGNVGVLVISLGPRMECQSNSRTPENSPC